VNFALYTENAWEVDLCLYDQDNVETVISLTEKTGNIWHLYIYDIAPGQLYGYRVNGPYEPFNGHRFNRNKLLVDPNTKAITGPVNWNDAVFGYQVGDADEDLSFNDRDSAEYIPKSIVINPAFDWENITAPRIPYYKTIIYEVHVKGLTKLNEQIPEEIRGTYAGLAHPVMINYFKELGITAVELMPVHYFIQDRHLIEKGLKNYWGYNTIGFFAPETSYSHKGSYGEQVNEFKNMVKEFHKAGIEVILDVVYNHTGEGNELGPTISFRGIDNASYYRLSEDKSKYFDYTGTGNTLNANLPGVLRLIMDSLRYWIIEMHVDGFRFDLAATLARELHEVNRLSSFFDIISQDPIISQVKLIAEPWDVGEGGYQIGNFPTEWSEWNGKYRDCMRDFWRGESSMLAEFAQRFTGSSDLYGDDGRTPTASINFITAHDGFTLHDLVSYNEKHNGNNGENNEDGEEYNRSWNCGEEGPTENMEVLKLRAKQKRNFLATLILSQGVPMIVAGDECGRTQNGNNNAYCQDNEISWFDWKNRDSKLFEFTKKLIAFRKQHAVFSRRKWFQGQPIKGQSLEDISWFLPGGEEMNEEHWKLDFAKSLGVFLNGKYANTHGKSEKHDDSFYILFNAFHESVVFKIPQKIYSLHWTKIIDTDSELIGESETYYKAGDKLNIPGRCIVVLENIQ
jgi:isoamylase